MRFRAPVAADAAAVVAVLAARDLVDYGVTISRLEDLRDKWRSSDLDLKRDAHVVEDEQGQIVAYASVRRHGAFGVVAPSHEGRGIGSRLLEWTEGREREHGHELHRQWVAAANASARDLLRAAGYDKARSYWRMVRALDAVAVAPAKPDDVRLRPVDPARDAVSLHALDAISFADAPDYRPESLQEFSEEHLSGHDFDAGLSRVADHGGAIVGFLIASRRVEEGVGYVDLLAVDPNHQRRGVGTALLQDAFDAFAAAGLREAQLMVASDNPRALRVYERAGMTVQLQSDIYERPISAPATCAQATRAPSTRWRSYRDVDAADDPDGFADELDDIASVPFMAAEKRRALELLELVPGAGVLDVGCGTGPELISMAQLVGPRGRVVGLERSAALIAQARERGRDRAPPDAAAIELVHGDAMALPFEDDAFEACRADRTLQHLDLPEAALAEMVRVVRGGGRVVVTESRWGLVAPSLDQELTDHVLGLVATGHEQTEWVGYRLAALCHEAGLSHLESLTTNHTAAERDEFLRFTQLRSAAARAVRAGALTERDAAGWLAQLEDLVARGDAFAMVLVLHVAGIKPAGIKPAV